MRRGAAGAMAAALALAACGSGGAGQRADAGRATSTTAGSAPKAAAPIAPAAGGSASADWPTFHADNARSGVDHSGASYRNLHRAWSAVLDGAIYAEPLVWKGTVIAATESDTVYGFAAASGTLRWRTRLATPVPRSRLGCGNIDPEGVTATPAVDPATGRLWVEAETLAGGQVGHDLFALDAASGRVLFGESDVPAGMNSPDQQGRSALLVADGRVYAPYGGLYGDCGAYHGWVVSAPALGPGPLAAYRVPTANEGAIWGTAGAVVDAKGNLLVATGNGSSSTTYDHGDSVVALSPGLTELDHWAPAGWAGDNRADLDIGSTSPQPLADGLLFQLGKTSEGYLLDPAHLGGIGGEVFRAPACDVEGGASATQGADIYVPCTNGGLEDLRVSRSTGAAGFVRRWTAPVSGSPIVAGATVWVVDGPVLYGIDPTTGRVTQRLGLPGQPHHFATPAAVGGILVVGAGSSLVAFAGS